MIPLLTYPLMLLGLASLPVVAGIYLFRSQRRPMPVSSLMLWPRVQRAASEGRRIERLETPLLFFLELLILALLTLAATSPRVLLGSTLSPLVILLDGSASMAAGGDDSPRERAIADLRELLTSERQTRIRVGLVTQEVRILSDSFDDPEAALASLDQWTTRGTAFSLEEALAFAREIGSETDRVLIVTDHAPDDALPRNVRWWSFGEGRSNFAMVGASRARGEGATRILLEVANLSPDNRSVPVALRSADGRALSNLQVETRAGRITRTIAETEVLQEPISAVIPDDALAIDNRVTLLSEVRAPVRVELRIENAALYEAMVQTLDATGRARVVSSRPELVISDQQGGGAGPPGTWAMILVEEADPEPFIGPFVLRKAHPFLDGVELEGVVWAANPEGRLPGTPLVTAGDTDLLAESKEGRRSVYLRTNLGASSVQRTAAWPILFVNILEARRSQRPGLEQRNHRVGGVVTIQGDPFTESLTVHGPDGAAETVQVIDSRAAFIPEATGRYDVRGLDANISFAANLFDREESDLRRASTTDVGSWVEVAVRREEYQPVAWLLLLAAGVAFLAHYLLVTRGLG